MTRTWTEFDDEILVALVDQRFGGRAVAEIFARSQSAIYARRRRLGGRTFNEARNDLRAAQRTLKEIRRSWRNKNKNKE